MIHVETIKSTELEMKLNWLEMSYERVSIICRKILIE